MGWLCKLQYPFMWIKVFSIQKGQNIWMGHYSIYQKVSKWVSITLTHWGRVTHICISKQTIIGSDNGLSPGRRQAIVWTNAGILLIGPLGTNFSEISIKILTFSLTKMRLKVSSAKWRPVCLGLNVLINMSIIMWHVKGSCFLLGFLSSPLAVHHRQRVGPGKTQQDTSNLSPKWSSNYIIRQFWGRKQMSNILYHHNLLACGGSNLWKGILVILWASCQYVL